VLLVGIVAAVLVLRSDWYFRLFHPLKFPTYIRHHAAARHLPADLVAALIYEESRFNEHARSGAGAVGLMQVTPDTANGIAVHTGGSRFRDSDLETPELNIRYGTWYLARLHARFDRSRTNFDLSLAAYNAGQGKVAQWIAAAPGHRLTVDQIPYAETRQYVRDIEHLRVRYRKAYAAQLGY
jgi:soluble lytic murein transglycosylase